MPQEPFQWAIAGVLVMDFLILTKRCFHGRKQMEPFGFGGFLAVVITMACLFSLHYFAGSFSMILR